MAVTNTLKKRLGSQLNAAMQLLGGTRSKAVKMISLIIRSLAVQADYAYAFGIAVQAAVGDNLQFAFGFVPPTTAQGNAGVGAAPPTAPGVAMNLAGNISVAEPGNYKFDFGVVATGIAAGVAIALFKGATIQPGSIFSENVTAVGDAQLVGGTCILAVTRADITAQGVAGLGMFTIRNVSGAALTLPVDGGGAEVGGNNIWCAVTRMPNLAALVS